MWGIILDLARLHLGRGGAVQDPVVEHVEVPPAGAQDPVIEATASEEPWFEVPLRAEQGPMPIVEVTPGDKYWVVVKAAPGKLTGIFNRYEHMRANVYDPLEVYCAGRREIKYARGVHVKSFKYVKDADDYWQEVTGTLGVRRF